MSNGIIKPSISAVNDLLNQQITKVGSVPGIAGGQFGGVAGGIFRTTPEGEVVQQPEFQNVEQPSFKLTPTMIFLAIAVIIVVVLIPKMRKIT